MFSLPMFAAAMLYAITLTSTVVWAYLGLSCLCISGPVYRNTIHRDMAHRVVGFYVSATICALSIYVVTMIPTICK